MTKFIRAKEIKTNLTKLVKVDNIDSIYIQNDVATETRVVIEVKDKKYILTIPESRALEIQEIYENEKKQPNPLSPDFELLNEVRHRTVERF